MNSATEFRTRALWALAGLLALAAGCADRGPTNLYSQPIFGQTQSGANLQVYRVDESALTVSPTAGMDGYVVWLKNVGGGGTVGPITATISLPAGSCATTVTYGAVSATAVFGQSGQVINPGDRLEGYASNASGGIQNYQYSCVASFVSSCAGSSVTFNVVAADTRGGSWSSSFAGIDQ
jgi:hypothetical protein